MEQDKIVIGIAVAVSILFIGWFFWPYFFGVQTGPRACTLEAKLCPDGSYVGRSGPNCQFAPCPEPTERGPVYCIQDVKICPDGSYVGRVPPTCQFAPCPGR